MHFILHINLCVHSHVTFEFIDIKSIITKELKKTYFFQITYRSLFQVVPSK